MLVQTSNGPVIGFQDTFASASRSSAGLIEQGQSGGLAPVSKWLGVPYAAAGRWERPSPPAKWTEPLKTQEFGSMFPQPSSGLEALYGNKEGILDRSWVPVSEDSFTCNVFAPAGADKLSVLVWIYGGSLNNGSADKQLYDPSEWIRREEQAGRRFLIVTLNYRTNIFGFCASADLLATDPQGLTGNFGLYDCLAALGWVKENISRFGGDPDNVTIFGESAGAFLVSALLVTGRHLFKRAIMQSGAPGTMQVRPVESSYPGYGEILNKHGIGAATPAARIASLRAVSWQELLAAHNAAHSFGGVGLTLESGPHALLTAKIEELVAAAPEGKQADILLGTNEDEGSMFTLMMKGLMTYQGFSGYIARFPAAISAAYAARYPATDPHFVAPESLASATNFTDAPASHVMAEQLFVEPARRLAELIAAKGKNVYLYRCREVVDRISTSPFNLGSMHSVEIPLVFNTSALWDGPESHEAATAKAMGARWAQFAITGSPNVESELEWKPFNSASPTWLAFNSGGVVANESL